MKSFFTASLVTFIMIIAILGIMNPGYRQTYELFGNTQGKLTHNYFIFSIYQQYHDNTFADSGKYIVYRRYIGIALIFFEISPLRVKQQ